MAGRRLSVLFEFPGIDNDSVFHQFFLLWSGSSGLVDWLVLFLTFRKENAEKWMICLVHYAGELSLKTVIVFI